MDEYEGELERPDRAAIQTASSLGAECSVCGYRSTSSARGPGCAGRADEIYRVALPPGQPDEAGIIIFRRPRRSEVTGPPV